MRPAPDIIAQHLANVRFPDASCVLMAGSIVRGQATASSDIDLVILHHQLPAAWRESFTEQGWPVEAFVHDLHTLQYFFDQVDRPSGVPSLTTMVNEGLVISGDDSLASMAKDMAQITLDRGPEPWNDAALRASRYAITDMIEDIRTPASSHTLLAALAHLYPALSNHYLRSRGLWSAKGKTIPRRLMQIDPAYAARFADAFANAFHAGETRQVIDLAEHTLEPDGGWLFESYRLAAPASWRSAPVLA